MTKKKPEPPENHERWLVSYADYMTLLFALFVVLYSFAMAKQSEFNAMVKAFQDSLGQAGLIHRPAGSPVLEGGTGILERNVAASSVPTPENKEPNASKPTESLIEQEAQLHVDHAKASTSKNAQQSENPLRVTQRLDEQEILGQLRKDLTNQHVEIEQLGQQLRIRITDTTLFPAGSAFIQPKVIPLIKRIAKSIQDIPGTIIITGHTDNQLELDSLYKNNWNLSTDRAVAIVQVLLNSSTIDAQRVIAQGRSDTMPIATNDTPENRAKNRRIELVITQGEAQEVQVKTILSESTSTN